jgi:RNA polymerase primary sigma factor
MSRRGGSAPDAEVATLRRYLKEIGRYPPLNHEQEVELAARIQAGDEDAVREMVESNLRFVVAYAKRYRNPNVPFLDLIHEGNLGLIQAAKKYDPTKKIPDPKDPKDPSKMKTCDVKFITYAVWWIRQAILHALAEHAGSFRLPQKQANTLYRMERIRSLLAERFARAPTDSELSEELGITIDDVRVLTRASRSSLSLNEPVDSEGDSELGDLLEQTGLPDTDELLLRESFSRALGDALAELPARERKVLELRFGLADDQPKTLREIGEVMGLSRERVRQIESRALNKLRRSHQKHSLQGFLR